MSSTEPTGSIKTQEAGEDLPIVFEEDDTGGSIYSQDKQDVTDYDLFTFAKYVLITVAVLFVLVALGYILAPDSAAKEVWDFTSVALNSIAALVLGYYFGRKSSDG